MNKSHIIFKKKYICLINYQDHGECPANTTCECGVINGTAGAWYIGVCNNGPATTCCLIIGVWIDESPIECVSNGVPTYPCPNNPRFSLNGLPLTITHVAIKQTCLIRN